MGNHGGLYEHFHPDEHAYVDRVLDWLARGRMRHEVRTTDFLDPRQAVILGALANRESDVRFVTYGGYPEAERKRAVIAPDYLEVDERDVPIALLSITSGDARFSGLDHGDFLGAMLGLGLKRDKLGDIHVHDTFCHVLVAEEMADFLTLHLQKVHRVPVTVETLPPDRLRPAEVRMELRRITVASMRLDGILSDVVQVSRAKIVPPIQAGRCKVNWKTEQDPSALLKEGDVVSLRGFGRFRIMETEGVSKSGRIRVVIGKYV
mgnify:FL=1